MTFVNLPLRYIARTPDYRTRFVSRGLHPELGFDALILDTQTALWHADTARFFHDHGRTCAVHLPFFDLHPGSFDRLVRETARTRLLQAVDAARVYKPHHYIAHLDYNSLIAGRHPDLWLEHTIGTWEQVLAHIGTTPLFLENVYERQPEQHVQVLERLGKRAGACFDIGHWHSFGKGHAQQNLTDWLLALEPFPLHLHLHDNDGRQDQHLGLGQGTIPLDQLWAHLVGRTLPVTATFEPHSEKDFLATCRYLAAQQPGLTLEAS